MRYIDSLIEGREVSQVALGCMRIADMSDKEADLYVNSALEMGYNYFDHADIYGKGRCEEVFGGVLARNPSLRDRLFLQTKCGIRAGMYDFSKEHIIFSVERSLKRLSCERIDLLLLHRPDLLMEPSEVGEAFEVLYRSGKVAAFGVSNQNPMQIELLQRSLGQKIKVNQLQLSVTNASMISSGANVNLSNSDAVNRDGYVRDYCRLRGIVIQPWSPLQHGFIEGAFLANRDFENVNRVIRELAEKYGVTDTGMAIAWLLRLPDGMQPIVGSRSIERLREIAAAADIDISREDWYKIYLAAGYKLP